MCEQQRGRYREEGVLTFYTRETRSYPFLGHDQSLEVEGLSLESLELAWLADTERRERDD